MFKDREEAARLLAIKLEQFQEENPFVFAIPRGAVGMGKIIANAIGASFDVINVRKIGAPNNKELAVGAVGPSKTLYLDKLLLEKLEITTAQIYLMQKEAELEVEKREMLYRKGKSYPNVKNETLIVVDDGVATGATVIAAAMFLRKKKAGKILLATPVIATDTLKTIKDQYDDVIYLEAASDFRSVGQFYQQFDQVSDDEVIFILNSKY